LVNLASNPLRATEAVGDNYGDEARLGDGVSDAFVQVVANAKLPRIEPDIDAAQVQILGQLMDPLLVL
jgi:hypothetical protein